MPPRRTSPTANRCGRGSWRLTSGGGRHVPTEASSRSRVSTRRSTNSGGPTSPGDNSRFARPTTRSGARGSCSSSNRPPGPGGSSGPSSRRRAARRAARTSTGRCSIWPKRSESRRGSRRPMWPPSSQPCKRPWRRSPARPARCPPPSSEVPAGLPTAWLCSANRSTTMAVACSSCRRFVPRRSRPNAMPKTTCRPGWRSRPCSTRRCRCWPGCRPIAWPPCGRASADSCRRWARQPPPRRGAAPLPRRRAVWPLTFATSARRSSRCAGNYPWSGSTPTCSATPPTLRPAARDARSPTTTAIRFGCRGWRACSRCSPSRSRSAAPAPRCSGSVSGSSCSNWPGRLRRLPRAWRSPAGRQSRTCMRR